jgi:alpha-1,6-mannosyltransferase
VGDAAPAVQVHERFDAFRFGVEFAVLGAGLALVATWLAAIPDWRAQLGAFQIAYAVGFAIFAIAVLRLRRYQLLPRVVPVMIAVAIACRLILLPATPTLSDDVYRYLWEGQVLLHGGNPWQTPPNDGSLAALRDQHIHPRINHPELAAIYPPLGVAGYALVAAIQPTVLAAKSWVLIHELLLIMALIAALSASGLPPAAALIYAWCPLTWVEFAGAGHNDPIAMAWLAVAIATMARRPTISALALVAGAMVKLVPLVALPFLWRRWPARARIVAAVGLAAGLGAYALLARGPNSGLAAYWQRWQNNDALFGVLQSATGSFDAARVIGLIVLAGVAWWTWRRDDPAPRSIQWCLRAVLITSPVVHPWYLGWNLLFEPWSRSAPWLLLSCLAVLNYGVLRPPIAGSSFHLSPPWRVLEYGLPLALAAGLAIARRSRSRRAS